MNEEVKKKKRRRYKTIERQKRENTFTWSKSSRISEIHVRPHELLCYTTIPRGGGGINTLRGIVVLVFTKSVGYK